MNAYHLLFSYLLLILFTLSLIFDLLFSKKRFGVLVAHWLVILGLLFTIPTILTGLEVEKIAKIHSAYFDQHRLLGFATGISASLYAGLRISAMLWNLNIKRSFYIGLGVLMLALVSWTSDIGVLMSQGVFVNEK